MPAPISERVQKRRAIVRAAGLRRVQIWAPDTRRLGFAAEYRRQAASVAEAGQLDTELSDSMDAAHTDSDE